MLNTWNYVSTHENGAIVNLLDYYPYGTNRIEEGNSINNKKYIGQEFDKDTELNYLNARYYNGSNVTFVTF